MPPQSSIITPPHALSSDENDDHPNVTKKSIPQPLQDRVLGGERIEVNHSDARLLAMRAGDLSGLVALRDIDRLATHEWKTGMPMLLVHQDLLPRKRAATVARGAGAQTSSLNIMDYVELEDQIECGDAKMQFSDEATLLFEAAFISVKMPTRDERQRLGDWVGV